MCSSLAETRINLENYTEWKIAVFQLSWQVSSMLSPRVREYFPNLILCFQKPSHVHWLKLDYAFVIWPFAAVAQFLKCIIGIELHYHHHLALIFLVRWSQALAHWERTRQHWSEQQQSRVTQLRGAYSIVAILSILQCKTFDFRVTFLFLSACSVGSPLLSELVLHWSICLFVNISRISDVLMCRPQRTFN